MPSLLLLLFAAYLVGSLSFAVIVSRAMGLPDPHSYGSGNPGATNVLRSGSRVAAALTLAGDALKGLVVLLLARQLPPEYGIGGFELALAGLAAFLGHLYPVFFGFRGGKGVATAGGVLFGLGWGLSGMCPGESGVAGFCFLREGRVVGFVGPWRLLPCHRARTPSH